MFKKIIVALIALLLVPGISHAANEHLRGMILLQVEENGEAWYIYPKTDRRYYLGRPADAFDVMRNLGLGIKHDTLNNYLRSSFPQSLSGMIMLDVERNGEAYYVYPKDLKGYYLGRPADAFDVMRNLGLGISNINLNTISIAPDSNLPTTEQAPAQETTQPTQTNNEQLSDKHKYDAITQQTFTGINQHRIDNDLAPLDWNNDIADIALEHSINMAQGNVEFSHDGFSDRMNIIAGKIPGFLGGAENIAFNNSPAPTDLAISGWLASPGHKENIENPNFDLTGIGVYKSDDGSYYFTQLFVAVQ